MKIAVSLAGAVAVLGCLLLVVSGRLSLELPDLDARDEGRHVEVADLPAAPSPSWTGFLYGRVTATDGQVFEGRLRWGRTEEAFWDDHFNGAKNNNSWADLAPEEARVRSRPRELFGVAVGESRRKIDLTRPFVARFGDITAIDVDGRDLRVTLKSGTAVALDRFDADDVADGIRIWNSERGTVDLVDRAIRRVEFAPNPLDGPAPARLHGTVQTDAGTFTGFIEWNRRSSLGSDELEGRGDEGRLHVPFEGIRTIEKNVSSELGQEIGVVVTLLDGRELELDGHPDVDSNHRGILVTDPRFGRVTVRWASFRKADFSFAGSGPGYDQFAPGRELRGAVTLRSIGGRLEGRLVFDLDESETTDTLDVRAETINYSIPFERVASIAVPGQDGVEGEDGAKILVTLFGGADLRVDSSGDVSSDNAGMLVFGSTSQPTFVPWSDVERIDFEPPPSPGDALDGAPSVG